jgi:hypothetical protein
MCSAAMAAFAIDATISVEPSKLRIVFRIVVLRRFPSLVVMLQRRSRDEDIATFKSGRKRIKDNLDSLA